MCYEMRTELSQFMDGEPVLLVGEIIKLGDYKFDGDAIMQYGTTERHIF